MTKTQKAARRAKREEESGARYSMFVTLKDGLSALVEKCAEALPAGTLAFGREAVRAERLAGGGGGPQWRVTGAAGETETADALICALPSSEAGRLFAGSVPEAAEFYDSIPQTGCAVVSLAFRDGQIGRTFKGMGFVVPTKEKGSIIAGSFSSHKYPHRAPAGYTLLRIFVGGARAPHLTELTEDELLEQVLRETAPLLGTKGDPVDAEISKWPRGMPQYHMGHLGRLARLGAALEKEPALALCGNAFTGVGLPNCIHTGELAAEKVTRCFESE